MADAHAHDNHGKTPAAWAGSLIALVGAIIAAVGVAFGPSIVMWIGLGVCVAAAVIGGILSKVGKGSTARRGSRHTAQGATRNTTRSA